MLSNVLENLKIEQKNFEEALQNLQYKEIKQIVLNSKDLTQTAKKDFLKKIAKEKLLQLENNRTKILKEIEKIQEQKHFINANNIYIRNYTEQEKERINFLKSKLYNELSYCNDFGILENTTDGQGYLKRVRELLKYNELGVIAFKEIYSNLLADFDKNKNNIKQLYTYALECEQKNKTEEQIKYEKSISTHLQELEEQESMLYKKDNCIANHAVYELVVDNLKQEISDFNSIYD